MFRRDCIRTIGDLINIKFAYPWNDETLTKFLPYSCNIRNKRTVHWMCDAMYRTKKTTITLRL